MLLGEALATCPSRSWSRIPRQRDGLGRDRVQAPRRGVRRRARRAGVSLRGNSRSRRLYGGVEGVLRRALSAVGPGWDARAGAAERKFAALAAASVARAGQILVVPSEGTPTFTRSAPARRPAARAGAPRRARGALGLRTVGHLAELPGAAVAERLGRRAGRRGTWRGEGDSRRVRPRPRPGSRNAWNFPSRWTTSSR